MSEKKKTLYIVQTYLFSLSDRPFSFNNVKPPWDDILQKEDIDYTWSKETKTVLKSPSASKTEPFIENVGGFVYADHDSPACNVFWKDTKPNDCRMKIRYFELKTPLKLHKQVDDITINGKIYIHVYRFGICAIIYTFSISWKNERQLKDLQKIIEELRPWRTSLKWKWSSNWGEKSLWDILNEIIRGIEQSTSLSFDHSKNIFFTSIKIPVPTAEDDIINHLLVTDKKPTKCFSMHQQFTKMAYLLISTQGMVAVSNADNKKRRSLSFFWKIQALAEYTHVKRLVYERYAEFLQNETITLRNERMTIWDQIKDKDHRFSSNYDKNISLLLLYLEMPVQNKLIRGIYHSIYCQFAEVFNVTYEQHRLKDLLADYISEINLWSPVQARLYNSFFSPIISLFH
jgi:hypothetical protein